MGKKTILIILLLTVGCIYLFQGLNEINYSFFLGRRIPKLLIMLVLGLGIGTATSVFQTVTNNRILTPSILGMDALFLFFNVALAYLSKDFVAIISNPYLYFITSSTFTIVASLFIYKRIFMKEHLSVQKIILIGMVLGTLLRSVSTLLQMMLDPNEFNLVNDLGFASINNANAKLIYMVIPILILLLILILQRSHILDLLLLGREQSINLGVDYEKNIKFFLLLIAILISITTSLVGPITFFGIVIVNIAREMISGYKHTELILVSGLVGSFILIFAQLLLERILNMAMPVGVLISFLGGFYFLFLLVKESNNV